MKAIYFLIGIAFVNLCIILSSIKAQDAMYLTDYDLCSDETTQIIINSYRDLGLCEEIEFSAKLKEMPQTLVYKCTDLQKGLLRKYWMVTLDDCFAIRYDSYSVDITYTSARPLILCIMGGFLFLAIFTYKFSKKIKEGQK